MNKDALWALLVVLLLTSMAAMMFERDDELTTSEPDIQPEQQETDDSVQDEPVVEPQHADDHLHPAPILSLISAEDDGSMITFSGYAIHGHPDQVLVDVFYLNESIVQFTPDPSGLWNLTLNTNDSGTISLNFTATHAVENTTSEPMVVDIDRTEEEQEPVDEGEGNETEGNASDGNSTGDQTGNETDDGSGNSSGNETDGNTGNETDNGTTNPTDPLQPTYDASDLGQFWLDVFRCQPGHNITQVDDLTTTAVETHECSVSITMNETHITIVTNGLPDHDFESTLACSQANDCTRAQNYEWTIPRSPVNDTTGGHDATNCPEANGDYECAAALGEVAIAVNGVPFYGPEDGPGGDAVASQHGAYEEDRQPIVLGVCHAHNGQGGTFHYHADANCLHWHPEEGETMLDYDISTPAAVAQNTANGSHSAVIGVSMDGYPIYGLWGYDDQMNIVEMKSSYKLKEGETGYNGIDDYVYVQGLGHLDVCNGHFGPTPEFPEGIYHYHSTMMNGEGDMGFPYFLLCYHGETFLDEGGNGADCSGFGDTWGPGIGPPPAGCEGGPNGQLEDVQLLTPEMVLSNAWLWIGLLALVALRVRQSRA
ncbi:YHYH protein [Candidatus Poseidoniaceae archaeon]|nr:YHYH protein [Candidatus Poseidoniaceae archaeon]